MTPFLNPRLFFVDGLRNRYAEVNRASLAFTKLNIVHQCHLPSAAASPRAVIRTRHPFNGNNSNE